MGRNSRAPSELPMARCARARVLCREQSRVRWMSRRALPLAALTYVQQPLARRGAAFFFSSSSAAGLRVACPFRGQIHGSPSRTRGSGAWERVGRLRRSGLMTQCPQAPPCIAPATGRHETCQFDAALRIDVVVEEFLAAVGLCGCRRSLLRVGVYVRLHAAKKCSMHASVFRRCSIVSNCLYRLYLHRYSPPVVVRRWGAILAAGSGRGGGFFRDRSRRRCETGAVCV